eukprot:1852390-Prymnesium_polylepis.1
MKSMRRLATLTSEGNVRINFVMTSRTSLASLSSRITRSVLSARLYPTTKRGSFGHSSGSMISSEGGMSRSNSNRHHSSRTYTSTPKASTLSTASTQKMREQTCNPRTSAEPKPNEVPGTISFSTSQ